MATQQTGVMILHSNQLFYHVPTVPCGDKPLEAVVEYGDSIAPSESVTDNLLRIGISHARGKKQGIRPRPCQARHGTRIRKCTVVGIGSIEPSSCFYPFALHTLEDTLMSYSPCSQPLVSPALCVILALPGRQPMELYCPAIDLLRDLQYRPGVEVYIHCLSPAVLDCCFVTDL